MNCEYLCPEPHILLIKIVRKGNAAVNKQTSILSRLVIENAIKEIKSRPDLSAEAKARGVRSLLRAKSRLPDRAGPAQHAVAETID